MIYNISSKDNQTLKLARLLKRKNIRSEQKKFVAEGRKIVLEALKYVPERVFCVIVSETFSKNEADIVKMADEVCGKVFVVPDGIFNNISDTETPQGILAVVDIYEDESILKESNRGIVILDQVSEPGNLGTVIRTAEALGFGGIYLMKGCADIYSPKTVRSTMGSVFRMKFKSNCLIEDVLDLKAKGFLVLSTTPGGEIALESFSAPEKFAIVIGNEANGVCDEILRLSDYRLRITMDGMAESLNAAVAAGIAMHWIKNQ